MAVAGYGSAKTTDELGVTKSNCQFRRQLADRCRTSNWPAGLLCLSCPSKTVYFKTRANRHSPSVSHGSSNFIFRASFSMLMSLSMTPFAPTV